MKYFLFFIAFFFSLTIVSQKDSSSSAIKELLEYQVTPLNKLNTRRSEFSPVKYGKGIVFVSEQKEDLIHLESTDADGHPYLDLYYSEKNDEGKYSKKKSYTKGLNTNFHDGPVSFSADLNEAYLTRTGYVVKDENYVNQSKLYFLKRKGSHWGNPEKFIFDSDEYSLGHASVSKDGRFLFFSSDMPGGFGGTDIYVCERKGDTWEKPKNLGPKINTSGMELFPHLRRDGILFYSSNKLNGIGGLDIFSAEEVNGEWILLRNEGLGINSPSDDFGIYFADSANGYFSSNRQGTDDIFSFYFEKKQFDFEGYVLNSNDTGDVAIDIKIDLKDKNGNPISSIRTGKNGYFKFSNLKTNESVLIDIDETDGMFNNKLKYYLTDKKRSIIRETQSDEENKFVFRNLTQDAFSGLKSEEAEDEKIISGKLFFNATQSPLANIKIVAKDEGGKILDEATTDANGKFVFSKIPPGTSILIELAEQDTQLPPNTEIALKNLKEKTIKIIKTGSDGKFSMNLLRKESIEISDLIENDTPFTLAFNAFVYDDNNNTIPKLKVTLKDENGNVIATQVTDGKGKVTFKKLDPDKNYLMDFDESDTRLAGYAKIVLKGDDGKIIKEVYKNAKGFEYQILKGDRAGLTEIKEEDTEFKLLFKALVYDEAMNLLPNLKVTLKDENGKVVYKDSTDKNGKIVFNKLFADKSYIIEFDESDTRLGNIKKIIIKSENSKTVKEIVRSEKGFVYKILSGEKAQLADLEVEDAPLTFIFKALVYDETLKLIPNLIVYLKDESGKLVFTDTTDANGKIVFNQLFADKNYHIEFDENDVRLKSVKKVVLKSENNKTIKEIIRAEKGFIYQILKGDLPILDDSDANDLTFDLELKAIVCDETMKIIPNLVIYLKDENGKLISTKSTDNNGRINFKDIISNKNYIIEFDEKDERLKMISKIIIKSVNNKIVKEIIRSEKGFVFNALKGENPELYNADEKDTNFDFELKAIVYDEYMKFIPDLMIYLKDENGNLISKKITDKEGKVNIQELASGKNYVIEFDENDNRLRSISKIIIKSLNNKIVREVVRKNNEFKYALLSGDKILLKDTDVADEDIKIRFKAFVYDENNNILSRLTVYLKDEKGNLVATDTTTMYGSINFNEALANQNFSVNFDEKDTRLKSLQKIVIRTQDGKSIREIKRTTSGFVLNLLKADKTFIISEDVADDINIKLDFKATVLGDDNKILKNLAVYLKNEKGILIKTDTTDNLGKINFLDLLANQSHIVEFDENNPEIKNVKHIFIKSENGKIIREINRSNNGFEYKITKVVVNDANEYSVNDLLNLPVDSIEKFFKNQVKIKENIAYKLGDVSVSLADQSYLDKIILLMKKSSKLQLEISGYADSRSSEKVNMVITEKRAASAAKYVTTKGIDKNRITTIGYGESKLKNKCPDFSECTEEQHAENRRTEYRLIVKE